MFAYQHYSVFRNMEGVGIASLKGTAKSACLMEDGEMAPLSVVKYETT